MLKYFLYAVENNTAKKSYKKVTDIDEYIIVIIHFITDTSHFVS